MFADYKCENKECNEITVFRKKYGKNFPKTVKCEKCKSKAKRQYSSPKISIAHGDDGLGNYQSSRFTPLNKIYGGYGRIAGVETSGD